MNDQIPPSCCDQDACAFLAGIAKAIGHPTRLRILRILLEREQCICGDIVEDLGQAQSTVSQHLKMMKEAGLIRGEVDGPRVCYCLDVPTFQRFQAQIASLEAKNTPCCKEPT